jgi:prolyl 4-hydroxylase
MNKIEEIFKAWNIALDPNEKQAELASKRIKTCNSCEYKVTNLGINTCSVCGCALKGKVFSPVIGACPKGKWDNIDKEMLAEETPLIQEFDNQLTKEECEELIKMTEGKMHDADVLGAKNNNYRTAKNTWINENNSLTLKIKSIVLQKTKLDFDNQELIHVVKYDVGGEYKAHHDFFHPGTDYYETATKAGGQRIYSCLFYLNDDFKGGETYFPQLKQTIQPKQGKLVIWKNAELDGTLNHNTLHAGLPVIEGNKWVCIIWVRERSLKIQQ